VSAIVQAVCGFHQEKAIAYRGSARAVLEARRARLQRRATTLAAGRDEPIHLRRRTAVRSAQRTDAITVEPGIINPQTQIPIGEEKGAMSQENMKT
jgi:hypothetical protein